MYLCIILFANQKHSYTYRYSKVEIQRIFNWNCQHILGEEKLEIIISIFK